MHDEIEITGIRGFGRHGVYAQERENGQEFIVDVCLSVDARAAGQSDDLDETVDYSEVVQVVYDLIVGAPVDLIESLAENIADACLLFAGVQSVLVTVHKPHAPIAVPFDDVKIRIERSRGA